MNYTNDLLGVQSLPDTVLCLN